MTHLKPRIAQGLWRRLAFAWVLVLGCQDTTPSIDGDPASPLLADTGRNASPSDSVAFAPLAKEPSRAFRPSAQGVDEPIGLARTSRSGLYNTSDLTCDAPGALGSSGTLACSDDWCAPLPVDVFEVAALADECLSVAVDGTTDGGLDLLVEIHFANGRTGFFDDELSCSEPTANGFDCPEGSLRVPVDGVAQIVVSAWEPFCDEDSSGYTLTVSLGDADVDLTTAQVADDQFLCTQVPPYLTDDSDADGWPDVCDRCDGDGIYDLDGDGTCDPATCEGFDTGYWGESGYWGDTFAWDSGWWDSGRFEDSGDALAASPQIGGAGLGCAQSPSSAPFSTVLLAAVLASRRRRVATHHTE